MPRATIAALACALAAAGVAVVVLREHRSLNRCDEATGRVFSLARAPSARLAAPLRRLQSSCPGSERLVRVAGGFLRVGRPGPATALSRTSVRREPDNAAAWATLSLAADRAHPAEAAEARRRALALNPLAGRAARP